MANNINIIYKYPLAVAPLQTIEVYEDFEILSLQLQNGIPVLWVLNNLDNMRLNILIALYGTGVRLPIDREVKQLKFIGTIQQDGYVWHYFLV